MVFKKLPAAITDDKNILEINEILKDLFENLVDILVSLSVDHTQYKGFNEVKEEIAKDEEYIRSQDLVNMFKCIFDFIKRYTYLGPYDEIYIKNTDNVLIPFDCITRYNIYSENTKLISYVLFNISGYKVEGFFGLFWLLYQIDRNIDTLKTYNEFWLNSPSLHYQSKLTYKWCIPEKACIHYRNITTSIIRKLSIKPTNENLQAFKNAQTSQDILKIFGGRVPIYPINPLFIRRKYKKHA